MAAFRPAGPAGPGEDLRHADPVDRRLTVTAIVGAALLVTLLPAPALPVLALGGVAAGARRYSWREIFDAADPQTLAGLFGVCVALGTLAATWSAPTRLVATSAGPFTAAVGALAAVTLNNLPAAVLLSAGRVAAPEALLLGLNLGPNLAVTGSLSAVLWYQSARRTGTDPSVSTFTRLGLVLAPTSIAACLAALAVWPVGHL